MCPSPPPYMINFRPRQLAECPARGGGTPSWLCAGNDDIDGTTGWFEEGIGEDSDEEEEAVGGVGGVRVSMVAQSSPEDRGDAPARSSVVEGERDAAERGDGGGLARQSGVVQMKVSISKM